MIEHSHRHRICRIPALVALLALASTALRAQDPQPSPSPAPSPPAERRSTFSVGSNTRNPFWPVGWTKVTKPVLVAPTRTQVGPEAFTLSSILLGPQPMAIIDRNAVAEGDVLIKQVAGQAVRLRIVAIRDGYVILDNDGEPIRVPLRRKGELPKGEIPKSE